MESIQLLKPIAPSKHPGKERPTQNSRDRSEIKNAFLPKELANIIKVRPGMHARTSSDMYIYD